MTTGRINQVAGRHKPRERTHRRPPAEAEGKRARPYATPAEGEDGAGRPTCLAGTLESEPPQCHRTLPNSGNAPRGREPSGAGAAELPATPTVAFRQRPSRPVRNGPALSRPTLPPGGGAPDVRPPSPQGVLARRRKGQSVRRWVRGPGHRLRGGPCPGAASHRTPVARSTSPRLS